MTADPLHEKLLALIDEYVASMQADDYPATWPLTALRAVVELHAPAQPYPLAPEHVVCNGCDRPPMSRFAPAWPCSTIQAIIARELGVDG